jgi:CRP/FNR family cyclic AMP-dependent transcriptional regulator
MEFNARQHKMLLAGAFFHWKYREWSRYNGSHSLASASSELSMKSHLQFPRRQHRAQKSIRPFDLDAFLASSGVGRTIHHYRPKQKIFLQGERADAVLYVQNGTVRLSVLSKQGKEATIALFGSGDFLGEGCIASDQPIRMATATASTDCSLLKIERKVMLRTLHKEHGFSDMFVGYVVGRHNRTQADLVDQLFNSSEKRLARALLILARFGKDGRSELVIPGISQETLAEMIGTTRPRVNFFMNKFRKLGFIEYNGGLRVHSSLVDVVLHD